ncbi:hypothetical protein FACS1894189_6600 [Planctomycetales bacterium]|nr:hypothetical protein FACS1894189_6600 [Planctomycetales bacterium]
MADEKIQNDDSSYPVISSYGLLWERDKVDWTNPQPVMNGSAYWRTSTGEKQSIQYNDKIQDGKIINFANQIGVYILYNDEKPVYVGRALGKNSCLFIRLFEHAKQNDKQEHWNKFSWFGICPVDRDNQKIIRDAALPTYSSELVVHVLEAVLIATAAHPLNRKAGDFGDAKKYRPWDGYKYMQVK